MKNKNKGEPINTAGIYYDINDHTDGRPQYLEYIWADPEIFTDEAQRKFLELPDRERANFIVDLLEEFYKRNSEYAYFARNQIYKEPMLLLNFFKGISAEHFQDGNISLSSRDYENRYKRLQELIEYAEKAIEKNPIDYSDIKLKQIWPILSIRDLFTESELATFYYIQNPRAESLTAVRADTLEYPLDKPNRIIWNLLESHTGQQIKFNMLSKDQAELNALTLYSINFDALADGLKITKKLTPFDKRVYIAASALYNKGGKIVSLSQIHYAMGNTTRPNAKNLEKINDAITKMSSAKVFIDNEMEVKAIGSYAHFFYDGALLPMERVKVVINGQITEGAIHLFREPPLMTFAKDRKQVTTIGIKMLQSPISKTDSNLLIEDYLIERIKTDKRNKKSCTILIDTLYENAGINTYKQRERAPEKIDRYLKHYKKMGEIAGYKIKEDRIEIAFE